MESRRKTAFVVFVFDAWARRAEAVLNPRTKPTISALAASLRGTST